MTQKMYRNGKIVPYHLKKSYGRLKKKLLMNANGYADAFKAGVLMYTFVVVCDF
jgi:hypothetical protein